jgi:hypothetical protein
MFMLPIRSIVLSKSKPWNIQVVEVFVQLRFVQEVWVPLPKVLPRRHQESRRVAGRVRDHVGGMRRGQFHHQPDDVARGAELPVRPGRGNLDEHVLVDIALGVPLLHRDVVEHVHHLRQQRRRRDGEARVLHMVRVRGVSAAELSRRALEREEVVADHREHVGGREVLEARPAVVLVGPPFASLPSGKMRLAIDCFSRLAFGFSSSVCRSSRRRMKRR